jgi:hypothetical protein
LGKTERAVHLALQTAKTSKGKQSDEATD